ncbi:MAG: DUF488 family protein [Elsteraceae bacterium]
MSATIFTIGYEKRSLNDLLTTLKAAGVATLIDVRDLPLSRRAGFSKRQLAAGLEEVGLRYVHLKPLGTPKEGRVANHAKDWPKFWSIVETQLARPEADLALQQAAALAQEAGPVCLLCYEANHLICHRLTVSERLRDRHGFHVTHLVPFAP